MRTDRIVAGEGSQLQTVIARERVGVRGQVLWSIVRFVGRYVGGRERGRGSVLM